MHMENTPNYIETYTRAIWNKMNKLSIENSSSFFYDHIFQEPSSLAKDWNNLLYPASEIYFSLLNPIFAVQISTFADLEKYPQIYIRDGIIGLIHLNHILKNSKHYPETVYINHEASYLLNLLNNLPGQTEVRGVRFCSKLSPSSKTEKVYINAILKEGQFDSRYIKGVLDNIHKIEKMLNKSLEIVLCCPQRISVLPYCPGTEGAIQIFQQLCKDIGIDVGLISLEEFAKKDISNQIFVDLNKDFLFYSDNYLTHASLQKGAIPLSQVHQDLSLSIEKRINLPPFTTLDIIKVPFNPIRHPLSNFSFNPLNLYKSSTYFETFNHTSHLAKYDHK